MASVPTLYSTMIQGGVVNIRDATLNMPIRQVNEVNHRDKALDLLRPHCALTALVDASHRYDPPRCAEATRREIIQKVEDWIRHDSLHSEPPSSIFWLYGGAGAGKSALAQTLAEKFKINEGLAASFFFFRTEVERNTGNSLIPTLALQLVQSFQGLTPIVEQIILRNADLFKKNRQTQMLELLVEPLIRLSLKETAGAPVHAHTTLKSHPRLVVIDGLDECSGSDIQCDLLRIIASAIPHMPYPLRFLITSRPESHITRAFQHNVGEVAQYNLSEDSDADSDIRRFLDEEFAQIRCTHPLRQHLPFQWPPPSDISPIVERSSAHFIYASTVIRFIQSPKHRPDDRLQVILGLKQPYERERPYALLDSLYTLIFLEIQDPSQLEKIHCAFGIIHLRSIKVGLAAGSQWTSDRHMIEVLLELRPGDLDLIFDPLLSLVAFDQDNIRVLHKSLLDYLLDPSRSRDFQLDLGLANESAANHILRENKSQDGWYLAEFHDFAYHCQFACLNDTLKRHLRPLACDPEMIFTESLSTLFGKSTRSSLLQSILYFLQAICRQDFDPSGHCYREYVRKKNQCLISADPLSQRLKSMTFWLMHPHLVLQPVSVERNLRLSLRHSFKSIDLKDLQRRNTSGFNGRTPIPAVNSSVIKSIQQEHEMFSSYIKAHRRTVHSFLEQSSGLVHSCHFVLEHVSVFWVTLMMLVTYTESGVRLSCSEFEGQILLDDSYREDAVRGSVEEHFRSTQDEVKNNHTKLSRARSELD